MHRLALAALFALAPTLVMAQAPDTYRQAFDAIQQAVADDDAEAFADWVSYPIDLAVDGEETTIEDAGQLAAQYHDIVTPEIAKAVTDQSFDTLFYRDQGAMFGNGQVWMSELCLDDECAETEVKIITIQSTAQ